MCVIAYNLGPLQELWVEMKTNFTMTTYPIGPVK